MIPLDKINKWKLLFHFLFFLSATFLLLRPYILGIDSYAFFLKSCNQLDFTPSLVPDLFFSLLPCSELVFNLSAILVFYIFTVFLGKIIELYYPEVKWKVMCLMFLAPTICNFFYQFEDAAIGMVFITAFLWLYLKAKKAGVKNFHLLVLLLVPIGLWIWKWALVALFALIFENFIAAGLFLLVVSHFGLLTVFGSLLPLFDSNNVVLFENQPGIAVFSFFLLMIGMFNLKQDYRRMAAVFIILGLMAVKFMFFALPFLMMGTYEFLKRVEKRWSSFPYINYNLMKHMLVFCIFGLVVPYMMYSYLYLSVPLDDDFYMINKAAQISQDVNLPLTNDWGLGYWLLYSGYDTNRYGGWTPGDDDYNHSIAITTWHKLDCGLIEQGKTLMQIRIYFCH